VTLLTVVVIQMVVGSDRVGGPPPAIVSSPLAATLVVPAAQAPRAVLDPQPADVAPPGPAGAKAFTTSPELLDLVHKRLGELRGIYGVAIKDLDTGEGVLVNADRAFPSASLFKLTVMYEAYRQREAGRLNFNEQMTLSDNYARLDLGTLEVPVGTSVSVAWALDRMITRSDNATANLLADKLGWPSINSTMQELGMRETRQAGDKITTSPRDLLHLLELLALGHGPSPAASTEMVELLLDQRVNDRLPAQLPRDTPVAHKTGNLDGVIDDVGIVYSPGATYVIALLTEEAPDAGPVTQAEAALSRAVYDYFNPPGGRARSTLRAPNPAARPTPVPPVVAATAVAGATATGGSTLGPTSAAPTLPGTTGPAAPLVPLAPPPPAPTIAVVASPGRSEPPTVAPPPTAVRPTTLPATQAPAPVLAPTVAPAVVPAVTAVRPTAPPAVPAAPPTEPARGPLPPTVAPAPPPTAVRPQAPAATVAPPAAPLAQPTARAPEAPRFGAPTAAPAR
jgi:beta-lactamase class A